MDRTSIPVLSPTGVNGVGNKGCRGHQIVTLVGITLQNAPGCQNCISFYDKTELFQTCGKSNKIKKNESSTKKSNKNSIKKSNKNSIKKMKALPKKMTYLRVVDERPGRLTGNYKRPLEAPNNRHSTFYSLDHFFCKFPHYYERVY